ncbi:hypothetical protein CROQUDRAFT_665747 [Cronartium quercuum f. sp. fusiforme G11]|uniref:OTU domain-containing protein n=1 Tax=Cronartium quercuum f. sp. fusiforme G11 TaxID=708437 RepID=A0A9P6T5L1_9BASI|nr:hypothetical protein CROQUDRAFT_665747 [Cronartium quercuum f. sp. fusiforme G11]
MGEFYSEEWKKDVVQKAQKTERDGLHDYLVTNLIKGDGNCQFRAVALLFTGNQEDHSRLRKSVCEKLETKGDLWGGYLVRSTYPTWEAYVTAMKSSSTYGDHMTLLCMAEICKRPIVVLMESADGKGVSKTIVTPELVDPTDSAPYLLYHARDHYELLVTRNSQPNVDEVQTGRIQSSTPQTGPEQETSLPFFSFKNLQRNWYHRLRTSEESSYEKPTTGRCILTKWILRRVSEKPYPYPHNGKGPRKQGANYDLIVQSDAISGIEVSYDQANTLLKAHYKVEQPKTWKSYSDTLFVLNESKEPLTLTPAEPQFAAFSRYLNAYNIQESDLKSTVLNYMLTHKTQLKGYEQMESVHGSWEAYCAKMSETPTPGDRFTLQALAQIYNTLVVLSNQVPGSKKVWLQEFSPGTDSVLKDITLLMYHESEPESYSLICPTWE